MNSFLHNIASDLLQRYGEDLHNVTVVFPNKRAALFLNHELALQAHKPLWSPQYTTISELFQRDTTLQLADRIKLIFELYKSYTKITGSKESLEQFYGWGELMLSDFDDIDKHLGNARQIFSLLGDIHEMDGVEYLTDEQQEVLQRFFKNFSKDHTTVLKQRFLELWGKFHDIYTDYHDRLRQQGIAYEGMLYRDAMEHLANPIEESPIPHRTITVSSETPFCFIGFNHLTTVEEKMMAYYISETHGKIYEDHERCMPDELSFISSPTDDLQARYITQWLTPERIAAGRKTAIVLADESLLETVLHCLPSGITLNITTGYPLAQSTVTSLIQIASNILIRTKKDYPLHNINAVLRHPLAKFISPKVTELHDKLNNDLIYYLTPEEIALDENLGKLFAPLKNKANVTELIERLLWIVKTVATSPQGGDGTNVPPHNALTTEALYRMYTLLNRLQGLIKDDGVTLDISLFSKLLQQIIQGTTIPFHGEPIEGIQVMGVLETRNLDFDHVLLLSCNEGKIPAKINDSSFLPHSIRVGYNLTTIENKVSIYEYYFERLLQRAHDVTITYNNATTNGKTGEMSRFMLQLIADNKIQIRRQTLSASQNISQHSCEPVQKTEQMIEALLHKRYISPSALAQYLSCQMLFYYQHVMGIRDDDTNDEEEMDNKAFGTIFHAAAEKLYREFKGKIVPHEYISGLLKEKGHPTLRRIVEEAFRQELFNIPVNDHRPTPKLGGLQVINFEMVVTFLVQLLRYDDTLTRLEIVDVEKEVQDSISVNIKGHERQVKIGGKIDRLDMVTDKDGVRRLRVIDYKTGRLAKKLQAPDIESIFRRNTITEEKQIEHAGYFLQAILYSYIMDRRLKQSGISESQSPRNPEISAGLLYVQQATKEDYDPLLTIGKERVTNAVTYLSEFQQELSSLLSEIFSLETPFCATSDNKKCENCSFVNFCH